MATESHLTVIQGLRIRYFDEMVRHTNSLSLFVIVLHIIILAVLFLVLSIALFHLLYGRIVEHSDASSAYGLVQIGLAKGLALDVEVGYLKAVFYPQNMSDLLLPVPIGGVLLV